MSSNVEGNEPPHFVNRRNERLYCRRWPPTRQDSPSGLVLVLHGYSEHSGLYEHVGRELAEQGLYAFAHDQVGFGQSDGERAHISDFNHFTDDVVDHVTIMKDKYPELPLFIVGHSMGGLVAVASALALGDSLAGLILIGPAIKFTSVLAPSAMMWQYMKVLALFSPKKEMGVLNPDFLCSDAELMTKYREDPLVYHGGMRARFMVEELRLIYKLDKLLPDITCALLTLHGEKDQICDVSGAEMIHALSKSQDKTLKIYEGAPHQIHNEPGIREECLKRISDWILARI